MLMVFFFLLISLFVYIFGTKTSLLLIEATNILVEMEKFVIVYTLYECSTNYQFGSWTYCIWILYRHVRVFRVCYFVRVKTYYYLNLVIYVMYTFIRVCVCMCECVCVYAMGMLTRSVNFRPDIVLWTLV